MISSELERARCSARTSKVEILVEDIVRSIAQSLGCVERIVRRRLAQQLDEFVRHTLNPGTLAIDLLEFTVPLAALDVEEHAHHGEVTPWVDGFLEGGLGD